ncbi:MAG: hypothetical protein WDO24_26920 [Pseudomonadota bacterium]
MQLLWRGISAYVFQHEIALMFGCASLPGIEPQALALPLSYLYYHHLAPPALRPARCPSAASTCACWRPAEVDPRGAMAVLPRSSRAICGSAASSGDGAVIDHQFNTTDVLRDREDGSRDRQIHATLRAQHPGTRRRVMPHSALLASVRLLLYGLLTLGLMPIQALALIASPTLAVRLPRTYHGCAGASSACGSSSRARKAMRCRPCSSRTTSPISTSPCSAR